MKKLLASDLDGTLIYKGVLDDFNRESILKLRSQNNIFGVSTGRPYNGVTFLKRDYDIEVDFYVLLNGALILDKELNVLKHESIPFDVVKEIFIKYGDCNLFGIDEGYETSILNGKTHYIWDNIKFRTIDDMKDKKCSLISIDFSNILSGKIQEICTEINTNFSDYVVSYRNSSFVDIVPKGCSKGDGVRIIAEKLGVDIDNVYTIGDSFNDLSMFEITKNSFTFPNVDESLKDYTNFIVDSVSECIDKYILGD